MKKLKYGKKGITLISLVITIIVLLILAGVTIATLTGNNGILEKAQQSKEKTEQAQKDEKEKLGNIEDLINEYSTNIKLEQVTDANPGMLEVMENDTNTYIINSIEDLVFFANDVTKGNTYIGKTVKLGLNLDFKSNKSYVQPFRTDYGKYGYNGELKTLLTSERGFISIGVASNVEVKNHSFYGTFDGNGCVINNLYINVSVQDEVNDALFGLFGTNYGTIKNLGLSNVNIVTSLTTNGPNTLMVGGISGKNSGTIQNCFSTGNVLASGKGSSKTRVGGIVGHTFHGHINNCYNISKVSGTGNSATCVGGVSGILNNSTSENCFSVGNLSISTGNNFLAIGGIIGYTQENSILNNSYSINSIINSDGYATYLYMGGIVGYGNALTMNNCHDNGIINQNATSGEDLYVGKIAGSNYNNGTITNCSYLKQEGYKAIGINYSVVNNNVEINYENQMPNVLDILGASFKKDINHINNGYPLLSWQ